MDRTNRKFLGNIRGPQGPAGTIKIGEVLPLPIGEDPVIENVGTEENAVLNFKIPGGIPGKAATITIGEITMLPAGSDPTAENIGTDTEAVLSFGIPKSNGIESVDVLESTDDNGLVSQEVTVVNSLESETKSFTVRDGVGIKEIESEALEENNAVQITFKTTDGKARTCILNGFYIQKSYRTVAEMLADFDSPTVSKGAFAVIDTGDVEDEENGRLYYKGASAWHYLTDLSGAKGIQGPRGIAATISWVSAETVEDGEPASVENIGTEHDAMFVFRIPKGEKGDRGEPGEKGEPGESVEVADIVEAGNESAVSSNAVWQAIENSAPKTLFCSNDRRITIGGVSSPLPGMTIRVMFTQMITAISEIATGDTPLTLSVNGVSYPVYTQKSGNLSPLLPILIEGSGSPSDPPYLRDGGYVYADRYTVLELVFIDETDTEGTAYNGWLIAGNPVLITQSVDDTYDNIHMA